jgi:hypothetical protein
MNNRDEIIKESIKKIKDDLNFDRSKPYSYDRLLENLKLVNSDLDNLKPYEFVSIYFEISKSFSSLGKGIALGFSDTNDKIEIIRNLYKFYYNTETETQALSIQDIIDLEIKNKIYNLNGDNNLTLGYPMNSPYYGYTSCSRTLLRMSWFLIFISDAYKNMIRNISISNDFSACLKKSYEDHLAPHHSWIVRNGAKLAMSFAPSSTSYAMKAILGETSNSIEDNQKVQELITEKEKLYNYCVKYLESKDLLNTP